MNSSVNVTCPKCLEPTTIHSENKSIEEGETLRGTCEHCGEVLKVWVALDVFTKEDDDW